MRKGKRTFNKRTAAVIATAVFSLMIIIIIKVIDKSIEPRIKEICGSYCKMRLEEIMSGAVTEVIGENNIGYSDITEKSEKDGEVKSLHMKTETINLIQSKVIKKITQKLGNESAEMTIPLGSVSDSFFLSGRGPDIKVRLMLSGGVDTDIVSSFRDAGINQTCHTIDLKLHADAVIIMPSYSIDISSDITCPIAQNIIIGNVPEGFLKYY